MVSLEFCHVADVGDGFGCSIGGVCGVSVHNSGGAAVCLFSVLSPERTEYCRQGCEPLC